MQSGAPAPPTWSRRPNPIRNHRHILKLCGARLGRRPAAGIITAPQTRSERIDGDLVGYRRPWNTRPRSSDLKLLDLAIQPQPDDTTCGPTCLEAVYRYYGESVPLRRIVSQVHRLDEGGTLAVFLATHALARGYHATIYTYNLQLFDPTWFSGEVDLAARLTEQARLKKSARLQVATRGYLDFLAAGGVVKFEELTPRLIREHLTEGQPILTGLSSTYLYGAIRERSDGTDDDVGGYPCGHFVVLCGYERPSRQVRVADPMADNPFGRKHSYWVGIERVLGAILLGIVTYDANLMIIEPRRSRGRRRAQSGRR